MPWQATLTSVSSGSDDPRTNTVASVQFTDGTRLLRINYQLTPPITLDNIKGHVLDDLNLLKYRDDNTVTLSSFVGITVKVSSGALVMVPSSGVLQPPSTVEVIPPST